MSNYSKRRTKEEEAEDLQKYVVIYLDNCHKYRVEPTWDSLIRQASTAVRIPKTKIQADRRLQEALINGVEIYYQMNAAYNRLHSKLNTSLESEKNQVSESATQEELVPVKEQKLEAQKQQLPKPETKKEEGKQMAQPAKNNTHTREDAERSIRLFVDSQPDKLTRAAYREFYKNHGTEQVLSESQLRKFFQTWSDAAAYAKEYQEQCAVQQVEKARSVNKKPASKSAVEKPAPKKPSKKQKKTAQPTDTTTAESLSKIVAESFKNMHTEGSLPHQFAHFVASLFEEEYLIRDLLLVFEQNEIKENKGSWKRHDAIIKHLDENPQDARQLKLLIIEVLRNIFLQGSLNASK